MPITPQNLRVHELIGLSAIVKRSLSMPRKGLNGLVVDETKNTLVLREKGGKELVVPKKGSIFLFTLPGGEKAELDGGEIAFRPFDRPKKLK